MKKKAKINVMELRRVIEGLEETKTFKNRSELYKAVADTDWAKNHKPKPVTQSVVMLRIDEYGIQVKTPKGRRGKAPGFKLTEEQKQKMREGRKFKKNYDLDDISVPETYANLLIKVASGNLRAAIKLKCLDCAAYSTNEIKYCTVTSCPLYNFRPYQKKHNE